MDTYEQLTAFYASLGEYSAKDKVSKSIGDMFDTLLDAAKAEHPGNPIVQSINPVGRAYQTGSIIESAGDIRTLVNQLLTATQPAQDELIF